MAHATIILLSDKCWQADIHHDDLPDIAVIHIPAFTTTEVRQVRLHGTSLWIFVVLP